MLFLFIRYIIPSLSGSGVLVELNTLCIIIDWYLLICSCIHFFWKHSYRSSLSSSLSKTSDVSEVQVYDLRSI
jgi:hypothetical protein